ncbi:hypothetical protein LLG96_13740 [bacterium]|nr:hypothetical protein [bacterium]
MFKQLMQIWSGQAFSQRVVDEFLTMLDRSEEMLEYAFKVLTKNSKGRKCSEKIYEKDQSINLTEREIRKQILIHLSMNPSSNIGASLSLISIVKDAERLGDYVKNLFELRDIIKDCNDDSGLFKKLFEVTGNDLLELFKNVSIAFRNSDKDIAIQAINTGYNISKRCEEIIDQVINSDYNARQAVVLALGARYMKRIARHLTNIVSSIINPLPELDYKPVDDE